MTEDEAKKLWCPFSRVVVNDQRKAKLKDTVAMGMSAANRTEEGEAHPGSRCLGSVCMAWEARPASRAWMVSLDGKPEELWAWDPKTEKAYAGRAKSREVTQDQGGGCGMIGSERWR